MNHRTAQTAHGTSPGGIYRPFSCSIESIRNLTHTEKVFRFVRDDGRPFDHRPGQFMQVSIPGIGAAPISVSSSPTRGGYLELAVRKVGRLTTAMHNLGVGDSLGLRGPFGTPFDTAAMEGRDLLLIAGGCGLAPMRSLIQYAEDRRDRFGRVTILDGGSLPRRITARLFRSMETVKHRPTNLKIAGVILAGGNACRRGGIPKGMLRAGGCLSVIERLAALRWNITLCGFVRQGKVNIHTHPTRILIENHGRSVHEQ